MFTGKCGRPLRRDDQFRAFMRGIPVCSVPTVWGETGEENFACYVTSLAERAGVA